jgi:hypothetical protein
MFNLILNTVEKKSFLIGASIASAVWLFVITILLYNAEPVVICDSPSYCNELPADSANVMYYERGYFNCLRDANPRMYNAYILSVYYLRGAEEQRVIDSVVFAVSNEYNFDDSDREYLHTLITD